MVLTMASDSPRKRALSSTPTDDALQPAKRQRTASADTTHSAQASVASDVATRVDGQPNLNEQHRMQLRRAITLALDHVGFDSASEEALESFTHMTETCQFFMLREAKFPSHNTDTNPRRPLIAGRRRQVDCEQRSPNSAYTDRLRRLAQASQPRIQQH